MTTTYVPPDLGVRRSKNTPEKWVVYNRVTGHGVRNPALDPYGVEEPGHYRWDYKYPSYFDSEASAQEALTEWCEFVAYRVAQPATPPKREPVKGWKRGGFHPALRGRERGKDKEGYDVAPEPAYRHPDAPGLVVHRIRPSTVWTVSHEGSGRVLHELFVPVDKASIQRFALNLAKLTDWTAETTVATKILVDAVRQYEHAMMEELKLLGKGGAYASRSS